MRFAIDMRSSQDAVGGIPEYTAMVAYHASRMAPEHEFVLFYSGTHAAPPAWTSEQPNVRVHVQRTPNKITNTRLYVSSKPYLDALIKRTVSDPVDVWFLPNLNFTALSPSQRMVLTMHDVSFVRYPEFFSFKQQWWHKAVKPEALVSRAQKVIAVSEHTKKDVTQEFSIPDVRIAVTPLGIDPSFLVPDNQSMSIQEPGRMILTYATGDPRKNLDVIVQGFRLLKEQMPYVDDVTLHIVGRQGTWVQDVIAYTPKAYRSSLHFHHGLDRAQTVELMRHSSLFVYPSFYEGFGLPLLEAMASRVPVITSPNSAILETGNDSVYYTDPYNAQAMKQAMDVMLSNTNLRISLVAKGYARAKQYSWERTARQTLDVLTQAATMPLHI